MVWLDADPRIFTIDLRTDLAEGATVTAAFACNIGLS
ncbi:MAG: hypothetical protein JWQ17_4165 [Tardiphaga sp.]|nr:hypothetical protein [Tardiphaga sp.]